jgi:calpain-7
VPVTNHYCSDDIELDETWERIKKAYDGDNAIITLGTGNMSPEEEAELGLVREHDYAVLDLKTDEENRCFFLIKNPWCDSLVWTGVGSSASPSVNTVTSPYESMTNMFWMAFGDVVQHFDSLYVNWNPALFSHRQDHHFTWETPTKTEELVFTHNPQYSVLSPSGSTVWVLLSRHWQDGELDILRERKAERDHHGSSLATVSKQLGFISLSLFSTTPPGTRVPLAEGHHCLHQSPCVDSPNTLLRYEPTPGKAGTLVVAQSELPLPKYSFTLSFFSHEPLVVSPAAEALAHSAAVQGAWTRRTAGGGAAHASYLSNPQFALALPAASPLSLVLSSDNPELPVHVAVLFSNGGQRITAVAGRDILGASVEYQCGRTFTSIAHADRGTYTVVVSTFEPGQTGRFSLRISATVPVTLKPVPADGAGRLRTPAPAPAVFGDGEERLRARVGVGRLTRVNVLARLDLSASNSGGASPAIRVGLEMGTGPHRTVLAVTGEGEFADACRGLRTGEIDLDPEVARRSSSGGIWLVVEQIGSTRTRQGVQVEVLSDGPVHLGGWENADD